MTRRENAPEVLGRGKLERLVSNRIAMEKTPAVEILKFQIDRNLEDIKVKNPRSSHEKLAIILAYRFLDMPMYNRLSGQWFFGPKPFERKDNPHDIEPKLPDIVRGLAKAEKTLEGLPGGKLQFENAWMYFTRHAKGKTAYRIYLSPRPDAVGDVFRQLAEAIPENIGYQMKTFDSGLSSAEAARNDKIIVYISEEAADSVWSSVQAVCQRNPEAFRGRLIPPGGLPTGVDGVSVARQPESDKETATMEAAKALTGRVKERAMSRAIERCGRFRDNIHRISQVEEGRMLQAIVNKLTQGMHWWLGETPTDAISTQLTASYQNVMYGLIAMALIQGESVSLRACRDRFVTEAQRLPLTPNQLRFLRKAASMDRLLLVGSTPTLLVPRAIETLGLGICFDEAIAKNTSPSVAFRELIADKI